MFHIEQLTTKSIIEIYTTVSPLHFPKEELRPLVNLQSIIDRNGYEGLGLYHNETNELAGYGFFVHIPDTDIVLLDYYAIMEQYRDQGVGSFFLTQMKAHYRDLQGILLETEDYGTASTEEERAVCARRDAFYIRNGAQRTSTKTTVFGVDFQIFFIPTSSVADDDSLGQSTALRNHVETLYRFMLPEAAYKQNVRWRS